VCLEQHPADRHGESAALASLPLTRQADGFTLCHGSLRDPLWEYVTTARQAQETLSRSPTPGACNGHTHVPALFRYNRAAAVRDTATVDHPHPLRRQRTSTAQRFRKGEFDRPAT
ncbi:MAG: hypothetical protein AAB284_01260, partial [Chloroflexota bacterium]